MPLGSGAASSDEVCRILLLSAAMGSGHLQIARELERRLQARGHLTLLLDQLDLMLGPTGRWLGWLNSWLVDRRPRLYQWIYERFFLAPQRAGERAGIPVRLALTRLSRVVEEFQPDLALSTYPLSALALGELRQRGTLRCPVVTVVTTFSVNNLWVHPGVDLEMCISEPAASDAEARTGRPAVVCGPVVRPAFLRPADVTGTRRRLVSNPDDRVALITTGSMGVAGGADAAATALARTPGWTPVVLCGHNEQLADRLRRHPGVIALNWVDDMAALMAAADVLVDNNCGMSAKEALAAGLPVVTFRPISGHGRDDAEAMAGLGLTDQVYDEDSLVAAVQRLVGDRDVRAERIRRGKRLFVADAAALLEDVLAR